MEQPIKVEPAAVAGGAVSPAGPAVSDVAMEEPTEPAAVAAVPAAVDESMKPAMDQLSVCSETSEPQVVSTCSQSQPLYMTVLIRMLTETLELHIYVVRETCAMACHDTLCQDLPRLPHRTLV